MHSLIAILSLAAAAAAVTIPTAAPTESPPQQPGVVSLCAVAENCETYDTADGLKIRFKAGMEPGSEDYNARFPNATTSKRQVLVKRDTKTHVTFGSTSINYGTTNPSDALHHCLYDYCHEGSCDPSPCTADTWIIGHFGLSTSPHIQKLIINSHGQYNGWPERNNYADAVVAAASKGQKWTDHRWCTHTRQGDDCGTQRWSEQTNFISLNKFSNGALQGFIEVTVAMDGANGGWCGKVNGFFGAITGILNPIAGGFFGAVSVLCG